MQCNVCTTYSSFKWKWVPETISVYYKKYYLGLSYLAKDKTELAIENLKIAATSKESSLKYKAKLYLALAYLKNKDKQNTIKVLKDLINTNSPYKQKAKTLYEKLIN